MARPAHPNQRTLESLPLELRRTGVPEAVRAWVGREAGSAVASVRRLAGASSTAVHRLRLADGRDLVLRRYVWPGFLEEEPDAPVREVRSMRWAAGGGLPVPSVVAADPDGSHVGDGVAVLLMTFVPGTAVRTPDLDKLAELAAQVHAVDADGMVDEWFPWYVGTTTAPPPHTRDPDLWWRGIRVWHEERPTFDPVFVHRDFHPGNVLWQRGRVSAVVDWANACRGPRGVDVAHCRANLLRLAGYDEYDAFRRAYERVTNWSFDPYWDVASLMENDMRRWTPAQVEQAEGRLARAMAELGY